MKRKYLITTALGLSFLVIYIVGYRIAEGFEGNIVSSDTSEVSPVVSVTEEILKKNTEYTVETYDNKEKKITGQESMSIPIALIGLNKIKTSEYLMGHKADFAEGNEEVTSIKVISFSEERVVIRKYITFVEETTSYDFLINTQEPKYYIMLEFGKVVVYRGDMTTLYMETGITSQELEESVAAELRSGICVENISELYRTLESFTS